MSLSKYEQSSQHDRKTSVFLGRDTNQALSIGRFAINFMRGTMGPGPDPNVLRRAELFHTDAVICGLSALALRTNAPTILREEALSYASRDRKSGATVFGSNVRVPAEKAVCANGSAVREWDSNGTVFGYNKKLNHIAGEFGHNDFYGVVIAAAQERNLDGKTCLKAMVLLDEIRGRLAEVFSLKTYKIDHVVHGAIASAATYGALMGATAEQIESAIGMLVAHYIPWRAIRAGEQLSDSKGASAAISTEMAILCVLRAMRGFIGPQDIFRNPEAIFRFFEPTDKKTGECPFNLVLSHSGSDFAVMGMHFKLGLYEHQSAGALQGVIDLVSKNRHLLSLGVEGISRIKIVAYQPAFGIIGDPHKRNPTTRQSADHSMVFIVSRKLRKAFQIGERKLATSTDEIWKQLILTPEDYNNEAIFCKGTRALMDKIEFEHGGKAYDERYPDGIPTSVVITTTDGKKYDSGLVMYPAGHARNTTADLEGILTNKFQSLAALAVSDPNSLLAKLSNLSSKTPEEIDQLYNVQLNYVPLHARM